MTRDSFDLFDISTRPTTQRDGQVTGTKNSTKRRNDAVWLTTHPGTLQEYLASC